MANIEIILNIETEQQTTIKFLKLLSYQIFTNRYNSYQKGEHFQLYRLLSLGLR